MASVTGTVVEVRVSQYRLTGENGTVVDISGGLVTVQPSAGGRSEKLSLWSDARNPIPDRITQSTWLSMCQGAATNGNEVIITTSTENSSLVTQVSLRPPQ